MFMCSNRRLSDFISVANTYLYEQEAWSSNEMDSSSAET